MKIFNPTTRDTSERHAEIYAFYELLYTFVDFLAALLFVIGSILFFRESTTYFGTWLFLIGSLFFGLKPTIRLVREYHLLRLGDSKTLAERAGS